MYFTPNNVRLFSGLFNVQNLVGHKTTNRAFMLTQLKTLSNNLWLLWINFFFFSFFFFNKVLYEYNLNNLYI